MYNFKHTFKRTVITALKLAVVTGCFYVIYEKLAINNAVSWEEFYGSLSLIFDSGFLIIGCLLTFSLCNWLLEILKWKLLVGTQQTINFKMAVRQCLSALTVSMATPNRIGDYVAKALYYSKKQTKTIIVLNAIGQFTQLFITLIFGIFGLVFLYLNFGFGTLIWFKFLWILAMVILIVLLSKKGRFYSRRVNQFYKSLSISLHLKVLAISLMRFLIFSHQFYFFMILFNLQVDYLSSMTAIFSMYLLASIIPTLTIFDWAVKGSAAVVIFGFLHVESLPILEISIMMWLLNFALPALFGSFFVLQFKTSKAIAPSL